MGQVTDVAALQGNFKEAYGELLEKLVPEANMIQKLMGFRPRSMKEGNKFNQPVALTRPHGFTYENADAGAFPLNKPIALQTKSAEIQGNQLMLRDQISLDAAFKASGTVNAFVDTTAHVIEAMADATSFRNEMSVIYGRAGIGLADSSVNIDATSTVVTLTEASYADAIWAGSERALINFFELSGGLLIGAGGDEDFEITGVDVKNRTITVTGTATGITALDAELTGDQADIFFKGSKGKEMAGIDTVIRNTGVLFNIDASEFRLWQGNTFDAGNASLSLQKILSAATTSQSAGLKGKIMAFCNPKAFANLTANEAALRRYGADIREAKNGASRIQYWYGGGPIEVIGYEYIKRGDCFLLAMEEWRRIGATDITFERPGKPGEFFRELTDDAGFELRVYVNNGIICKRPAWQTKIENIKNLS